MSLHEDPRFTIELPDGYPSATAGPVRHMAVVKDSAVVAYVWASTGDDAAGVVARPAAGAAGFNAEVAWIGRLRTAKAEGLGPLQALDRWVGAPEDHRSGSLDPATEETAPTQAALIALARA
ncbi:hypothetical protein [Actinoallomurus iriomotensis]|uniref:Uncharacterized protein n=1 Tax=Actinoallomurus iriomotensis TaxID=478107 RepID=A0A9W6S0S1_9ACTN|nr:hypothetical protein [Actinoallomurus iriomotensis]GLY85324.1 hypothetical protein Airi02_032530 [Actinoallomurus iriomotensis]